MKNKFYNSVKNFNELQNDNQKILFVWEALAGKKWALTQKDEKDFLREIQQEETRLETLDYLRRNLQDLLVEYATLKEIFDNIKK